MVFLRIIAGALCLLSLPMMGQDCQPQAEAMSRIQLISFLNENARGASPECLTRVIIRVSELRPPSREATETLISLLDFRRLPTEGEKVGVFSGSRDNYPAVSALLMVGPPAVAPLIEDLKRSDLGEVSRQNALRTLILIHAPNPPEAISALKQAAADADDPAASERLEADAKDAIRYCLGKWRAPCEAAESGAHVE